MLASRDNCLSYIVSREQGMYRSSVGSVIVFTISGVATGECPPVFDAQPLATTNGPQRLAVAHIDADSQLDVVVAAEGAGHVIWYHNNGAGAFFPHEIPVELPFAWDVDTGDLDNDGDTDIVVALADPGAIGWLRSDGGSTPSFDWTVLQTGLDAVLAVHVADINRDGWTDIVAAENDSGVIFVMLSDQQASPTFLRLDVDTAPGAGRAWDVTTADFDSDGHLDIATISDGEVRWLRNDGQQPVPGFVAAVIETVDGGRSVTGVDLDRDGDADILATSRSDNSVRWYDNMDGTFVSRLIDSDAPGAWACSAGYFDGDGFIDVIATVADVDEVRRYSSDGGSPPVFVECEVVPGILSARDVIGAEFVGGGAQEFVASAPTDDQLWFGRNILSPVCAQDLDGDGTVGAGDLLALLAAWGGCTD